MDRIIEIFHIFDITYKSRFVSNNIRSAFKKNQNAICIFQMNLIYVYIFV